MEQPPSRPAAATQRRPPRKPRAPPGQTATASGIATAAASAAVSNGTNGTPRAINGETAATAASRNGNQRNGAQAGRGRNSTGRRSKPPSSAGAVALANGDAMPRAPHAPRPKIPLTDTNGLNPAAPEWTPSASGEEGGPSSSSSTNKPRKRRPRNRIHKSVLDSAKAAEDLTGSLIEGITDGSYECMICYDSIKHRDSVWSCTCCYAVFHLRCVEKWGKRSAEDSYRAAQASNASASDAPTGECPPAAQTVSARSRHAGTAARGSVTRETASVQITHAWCDAAACAAFVGMSVAFHAMGQSFVLKIGRAKRSSQGAPSTVLPCNDNCERLKRNRKLAEAFNIDTSVSAAPSGPTVEYSEALIRHAHANPSWVKSTEEALAAFVEDPAKRMFHFPSGKTAGNPQLLELAKHYDLAASIIDADRKGLASVTVRKTAAKTASIPSVLLSAAAASWKPGSSSSSASASKIAKASTSSTRESINALHVTSLQGGMELRDLHLLLEPVFCGGYVNISVRKLGDHDAVVIVCAEASRNLGSSTNGTNSNATATPTAAATTSRLAADDIENLLVGVEPEVRAKFVGNNWAKDVTLCHVSPTTGEVVLGSRPQKTMGPGAARAAYNDAVRKDVVVSNAFTSLSAVVAGGSAGPSLSSSRPPAASGVGASTVVSTAVAPQPPPPPPPVLPRAPTPEAWDQDSSLEASAPLSKSASHFES
ncbi:FKBP12-associated protein [Geranomyces variabilis]|uniref:FKBP12-associated protein n=1 Tax=Geranomyces variabilis TaxID=109894 RepID=A0AAD5TNL8_9FUNG|nr:FKBP12-associated protein [Geranomyces variabilis]